MHPFVASGRSWRSTFTVVLLSVSFSRCSCWWFAEPDPSPVTPTPGSSPVFGSSQNGSVDADSLQAEQNQTDSQPSDIDYVVFSDDRLQLAQIDMNDCREETTKEYASELGEIHGLFAQTGNTFARGFCIFKIAVPSSLLLSVVFEVVEPCTSDVFSVVIADKIFRDATHKIIGRFTCFSSVSQVFMPEDSQLHFQWTDAVEVRQNTLRFKVRYQATRTTLHNKLKVVFTALHSGYMTQYGFNGRRLLADNIDAAYHLKVPYGYVVMLSLKDGTVGNKFQIIRIELDGTRFIASRYESVGISKFNAQVYDTSLLIEVSKSSSLSSGIRPWLGFELLFSLHTQSEAPSQNVMSFLPQFNCAVPYYASFKQHLHCNLHRECQGGEDEGEHCPFKTTGCKQGGVRYRNKCYAFIRKEIWEVLYRFDPELMCTNRGGHAAMMKSKEEWETSLDIFRYGKVRSKAVSIGLKTCGAKMPDIYKKSFQWADGTVSYGMNVSFSGILHENIWMIVDTMEQVGTVLQELSTSNDGVSEQTMCQFEILGEEEGESTANAKIQFPLVTNTAQDFMRTNQTLVKCPAGHYTHAFLICDRDGYCGVDTSLPVCPFQSSESKAMFWADSALNGAVAMFVCENDRNTLHYTLVCDYRDHCMDRSDEEFCERKRDCSGFTCSNGQCVSMDRLCDFVRNCVDGSDEDGCAEHVAFKTYGVPPPAVVDFEYGAIVVQTKMNSFDTCPQTHFPCPGESGYCLPVYVRCNGVYDCPDHEDEAECQSYTCPGFYRCRASSVCVHLDHLCDGLPHCPQHDDELLCDLTCPQGCRCQGLAFVCNRPFSANEFVEIRYLDAAGSGMTPDGLTTNVFLVWLSLASCNLNAFEGLDLPNLQLLDLSRNKITSLSLTSLRFLPNLKVLTLTGNPLESIVPESTELNHPQLKTLDLSATSLQTFDSSMFKNFVQIQFLNVSYGKLTEIYFGGFSHLQNMHTLDIRGRPLRRFPTSLFRDLSKLRTVYAENHDLCCKALLPDNFDPNFCFAPQDEISSCNDLLRSGIYRVCLWVIALSSVIGNAGSFTYRLVFRKSTVKSAFNLFVTSLCIADFLMGVYLCIVGGADGVIGNQYILYRQQWTNSAACSLAGFLSLLSNEVSAFMIVLITLDRCIVLRFPFSTFRFTVRSAVMACFVSWTLGLLLASVPFFPAASHWEFYGQTGICIPLPITRKSFEGRSYSFAVMIVLNFVLFLLIAIGQAFIYWSVRLNTMSTDTTRKAQDLTIARRLITVAVSDFLCWFPIGLLGMMAATGVPIPGEFNVITAIFVLPLNSALNPFLYTYSVLAERRRKAKEAGLLKLLETQMTSEERT